MPINTQIRHTGYATQRIYINKYQTYIYILGPLTPIQGQVGWLFQYFKFGFLSIWLKSDLHLRYRIVDLITPHYWSCSVLITLTNQIVTLMRLKVFRKLWPFDLLIWVHYMPEVTRKLNLRNLRGLSHVAICKLQSSSKCRFSTTRNGKLWDPLCDRVKRGLTLVRWYFF